MPSPESKFRAIIVGAGPAGLAVAHCLSAAGVDFTILERRKNIVEETGASLGLWPHSVRVLDQLQLLDSARKISEPLKLSYHFGQDGKEISKAPIFDMIEQKHGYPFMLFERMRLVEMLYEKLSDKSKVKISKCVVAVEQDNGGVKVLLDDGTFETGDIVIGADGVHSSVRGQLWNTHAISSSTAIVEGAENVLTVGYKCLFGCSTREAGDSSCDMIETHNVNFSFQLLSQPERVFWFLYVKLDNSARGGTKYTAGDAETLAEQYLHHPITPTLTFQTLWKHRIRVTLADLEQGIQQRWYNGRIVLVGDAAHKMTPNLAFGFNTALESATALTNHLKTALAHSKSHTGLDLAEVDKVFSDYQIQRFARAKRFCDFANLYTRFAAWQNPAFKWASKFAPKVISDDVMVNQFAKLVKGGVKLDFIEVRCKSTGTIKFDDEC